MCIFPKKFYEKMTYSLLNPSIQSLKAWFYSVCSFYTPSCGSVFSEHVIMSVLMLSTKSIRLIENACRTRQLARLSTAWQSLDLLLRTSSANINADLFFQQSSRLSVSRQWQGCPVMKLGKDSHIKKAKKTPVTSNAQNI